MQSGSENAMKSFFFHFSPRLVVIRHNQSSCGLPGLCFAMDEVPVGLARRRFRNLRYTAKSSMDHTSSCDTFLTVANAENRYSTVLCEDHVELGDPAREWIQVIAEHAVHALSSGLHAGL